MSITLALSNIDPLATSINIYRGVNTPVSAGTPGTPYATIAAPATSWVDTDVVNYNVYHYRIEVTNGTNKTIGDNQMIGYYPDSGPGNNAVRRGDWMSGWMDELTPEQFITTADLITWLTSAGLAMSTSTPTLITGWNKVTFRGKILLIPNGTIGTVSWLNLYHAGLIYGTNNTGVHPAVTGLNETNQRKTITIKGSTYIVRTIRTVQDTTNAYVNGTTASADMTSENNNTRVRLCADTGANPPGLSRFSDITFGSLNTLTAQPTTLSSVLTATSGANHSSTTATSSVAWMPVLELAPGL